MTELNPPGFLQNRTDHSARIMRNAISGLILSQGVVNSSDMLVTQRAAGVNMSVDISSGAAYIAGTEATNQGHYYCYNDTTLVNKTVTAAHATLARKDIVIARVYDAFYSGATNLWQFEVIAGTPSGSPVVPATPANSLVIATIDIAAAATTIVNANINTLRSNLKLQGGSSLTEVVTDVTISGGIAVLDTALGAIIYIPTAPTANFTINVTNAATTNGTSLTITALVVQGATGYIPNVLQVAGSAQTIKWVGGTAPTPTSTAGKVDIYSFTLIRRAGAWEVLGSSQLRF